RREPPGLLSHDAAHAGPGVDLPTPELGSDPLRHRVHAPMCSSGPTPLGCAGPSGNMASTMRGLGRSGEETTTKSALIRAFNRELERFFPFKEVGASAGPGGGNEMGKAACAATSS